MVNRCILLSGLLLAAWICSSAQENTIAPGENLVLDGVPKISASLAETIERYTENREAFQTDWHPSRREMLIGTRFVRRTVLPLSFAYARLPQTAGVLASA